MAEEPQMQAKKREVNGRFPKGVSGNPGGRPKNNHTSIINLLEKKLEEQAPHSDRTYKELIVQEWLETIISSGDKQRIVALKEALDRLYGKPKESIELSGNKDKPIAIKTIVVEIPATVKNGTDSK